MTQNLLLLKAETWDAVPKLWLYQYASVSGLLIWGHFGVGRVSSSPRSLSCFRPTFLSVRGIAQSVSRDHASGRGKGRDGGGGASGDPDFGQENVVDCSSFSKWRHCCKLLGYWHQLSKKKSGNRCNYDMMQDIPPRPRKILGGGGRHVCPIVRRIRFGRFH